MADCVIVVQRDDGLWDASCFDDRCGGWLHGLGDDDGIHETEAAARKAAAQHRRSLAAMGPPPGIPAARCPTCKRRYIPEET